MACFLTVLAPVGAQEERPSDEAIAALHERGRLIALYFQAVERAAELLKKQGNSAPPSARTVVIPDAQGWRVILLEDTSKTPAQPGPNRTSVAIVAETTFSPDAGEVGVLGMVVPPRAAPASIQSYARALEQAETAAFGRPDAGRPFEEAIVREKDGTYTAYLISQSQDEKAAAPADGTQDSVLFGRDFAVRIAPAGRQVQSVERLHDSLSTLSLRPRAPGEPLLHEHDKGNLPSATDVALVLRHPVLAPLLVLTPHYMFRIDREGNLTWLGPNPNPKPAASPIPAAGPSSAIAPQGKGHP